MVGYLLAFRCRAYNVKEPRKFDPGCLVEVIVADLVSEAKCPDCGQEFAFDRPVPLLKILHTAEKHRFSYGGNEGDRPPRVTEKK